jgi:hypothetical protein
MLSNTFQPPERTEAYLNGEVSARVELCNFSSKLPHVSLLLSLDSPVEAVVPAEASQNSASPCDVTIHAAAALAAGICRPFHHGPAGRRGRLSILRGERVAADLEF